MRRDAQRVRLGVLSRLRTKAPFGAPIRARYYMGEHIPEPVNDRLSQAVAEGTLLYSEALDQLMRPSATFLDEAIRHPS